MTSLSPGPDASRPGIPAWGVVPALLVLGGAVRALRFAAPLHWPYVWDEILWAVPALHILRGGLPAIAGPEHFGAAPSYPLAAWFAVAGDSTLALDAFAYAVGLLILWTTWLILRRVLERPAALLGLAVLAVPPLFLAQWSLMSANHVPNLLVGNLCLLATHTIFVADPGRRRAILVFGLLAGLGWWTSPLIVVYLAPFAVLAVRTGLILQPRILWALLGLLLGGLPQWLYEHWYFPSAKFGLYQEGSGARSMLDHSAALLTDFLPQLLGFHAGAPPAWRALFFLVAVPLWLAAVLVAAIRDRSGLAWLLGRSGRIGRGPVILWILAASHVGLMLTASHRILAYYQLPLYSVFPYWMGSLLACVGARAPRLAGTALLGLLALNGWTNWQDSVGTTNATAPRWSGVKEHVRPLLHGLEERGLDRVYLTGGFPYRTWHLPNYTLTYLSGGRVVFANLWDEQFVANGRLVDAAANPAILAPAPTADILRGTLLGMGFDVQETEVAGLRALELTPRFTTTFRPLPRDRWTITASHNNARAVDLRDGDAASSWDTGGEQTPGQWLAVDLGAPQLLARVDLLAIDWQEMPGGLQVETSEDGRRWRTVSSIPHYWGPLFFSEHHPFFRLRRGRVQAIFPPVVARHVRLMQTASSPSHSWAARELVAYGPGGPRPPLPRPGEITAALRREGIRFVYASHWLSAWVRVDSHDAIGALDSNMRESDSARLENDPTTLVPLRFDTGTGILLGADADPAAVLDALLGQPVTVREATAGPYHLLVLTPTSAPHRVKRSGWRASASEGGDLAQRAIDGDRRTAWVSRGAGGPDMAFTVDLGRPQALRGVEVRPGLPGRELRLAGSLDGATWTPLSPLAWAGALYWTGTELLRNGGPRWAVTFPRTTLRYLRLSPAGPLRDPWTLTEIQGLE